jgi:hypothetical protein
MKLFLLKLLLLMFVSALLTSALVFGVRAIEPAPTYTGERND